MHICVHVGEGRWREGGSGEGRQRDVRKVFTEKLTASAFGGGTSGACTFASIL